MTTEPVASESPAAAASARPVSLRQLWQVPVFLAGLLAIVAVGSARPLWRAADSCLIEKTLTEAREALAPGHFDPAKALELVEGVWDRLEKYPDRAGEAHFLLGSAFAFLAGAAPAEQTGELHEQARSHLQEAEALGVAFADRASLACRLGKVHYHLGADPKQVIAYLADSVKDAADDPVEGYEILAQSYLRLQPPDEQGALGASKQLLALPIIDPRVLARARLMRGELLLRLDEADEARLVLARVGPSAPPELYYRALHLLAQGHQAEGDWKEAAEAWEKVRADPQSAGERGRVLFDLGQCYRFLGKNAEALRAWEEARTCGGEDGQAAALLVAELRLSGNKPADALEAFEAGVKGVTKPDDYRNELVNLGQARAVFERGCQVYREAADFQRSQHLARLYEKLAPPGLSQELFGLAAEGWAGALRDQARRLAGAEAQKVLEAARQQNCQAGAAFEAVAAVASGPATEAEWLWRSADQYRRGEDHAKTAAVLERFVKMQLPPDMLGEAWFVLAQSYRARNQGPLAQSAFQRCLEYPSRFAFQARYEMARFDIEGGDLDAAEAALQHNLDLMRLAPDAEAHEQSLYALANLLYQRGNYRLAHTRLQEALERYPANPSAAVTRARLARCYRELAEEENRRVGTYGSLSQEAQRFFLRQHHIWLEKAVAHYQKLIHDLTARQQEHPLTPGEESLLQMATFAVPDCRFLLGDYEDAGALYELLAAKYHNRSEGLTALYQATRCYWAMGKQQKVEETLQRVRTLLKEMDDATLSQPAGSWTRKDWEGWLKEAGGLLQEWKQKAGNS